MGKRCLVQTWSTITLHCESEFQIHLTRQELFLAFLLVILFLIFIQTKGLLNWMQKYLCNQSNKEVLILVLHPSSHCLGFGQKPFPEHCAFQWAEVADVSETPLKCFSPFDVSSKRGSFFKNVKNEGCFYRYAPDFFGIARQPDLSSFPLTGWWCGSLAKKKVWQRNPCPHGGRQPLGCGHAHVRVHRHPVLHALLTSAGFLAKFQGHRYLLAVAMLQWEPLQKLWFVALVLL